jgi:hypothetical protein
MKIYDFFGLLTLGVAGGLIVAGALLVVVIVK